MTRTGEDFAVPPVDLGSSESATVDALSDVLEAIRLRGAGVSRNEGQRTHIDHARGARLVHLVGQGAVELDLPDTPTPVRLGAGEMAVMARGREHGVNAASVDASWLTGEFDVEAALADRFLHVLPDCLVVRHDQVKGAWLPLSHDLLLTELDSTRPGTRVMISRILDLLFVHALRDWASQGDVRPGWLTGALDPAVGPVLAALHRTLGRPWPVDSMARLAGLSRSAFASRFSILMGQSPVAYLAERRLDHAAELLRSSIESVHSIGAAVGYSSQAAFSRAFHRRFGASPQQWRSSRRQAESDAAREAAVHATRQNAHCETTDHLR